MDWLQLSRNYSKWSIIGDDSNFDDFCGPKVTSFSREGYGRKYFWKSIVRVFCEQFKYCICKRFSYFLIFLMFWKLIFIRVCQMIFCDLEIMTSRNFCYGGIVLILLDLKWFVLPAMIAYFLRYPVSAVYVTFLFWPEFQRLGDRTSRIRQATYVINLLLWLKLVFGL